MNTHNPQQATQTALVPAPSPLRRHDMDWLRVIAFGLLVFFHAAVLFTPNGIPMLLNETPSRPLSAFVHFLHQFRLSLLFLVSGMGVCFALQHRSRAQFFHERSRRLLIPLVFGILVVVPPMVWLEKRYIGEFSGSLLAFYPTLATSGAYPSGNLSWHHYWFTAYLFLFCLLTLPLIGYLRTESGARRLSALTSWIGRGYNLFWLAAPLLLIELALRPVFPGFRDLIHDWASFTHWFVLFLAGFTIARHFHLLDRCREMRLPSLALALASSALLFVLYYDYREIRWTLDITPSPSAIADFVLYSSLRILMVWAWLLACTGFAARYLNRPSRILGYLNGAIYPLFCLHLTISVAIAFFVMPTGWPIAAKYALIVSGTFAAAFTLYEGLIRRNRWLDMVFGGRWKTAK